MQIRGETARRTGKNSQPIVDSPIRILRRVWCVGILSLIGIVLICSGLFVLIKNQRLAECIVEYEDPPPGCGPPCRQYITIDEHLCRGRLLQRQVVLPSYESRSQFFSKLQATASIDQEAGEDEVKFKRLDLHSDKPKTLEVSTAQVIQGPTRMYYQLEGYDQGSSLFRSSRDRRQLHGEVILDRSDLKSCEPAVSGSMNYLILVPCGLAALTVFNDSFSIVKPCSYAAPPCLVDLPMRTSIEDIVWPKSSEYLFRNPKGSGIEFCDEWLPESIFPGRMENAHFQVWMRPAVYPRFRKLYGIIDQDLVLPITIEVLNRYPINRFGGKKRIIIAQTSPLGTRTIFIGSLSTFVGALFTGIGITCAGCKSLGRVTRRKASLRQLENETKSAN